ncbi:hypothetical protein DHEL01_v207739 [Diaporthe helianthi]|uniref:Aminoglycoside phosphotransferase domain-containing protein n=1 Tax=Diaporthe helianthi TaxID=158607 RepID=A0A2P5HUE4_DIAHE|nr:hypothetical protein DHEL01_v207739 [Diaporthe helianthi]
MRNFIIQDRILREKARFIESVDQAAILSLAHVFLNTTIPVPKIHAYSFSSKSPIGMAFIIMDFVDGQNLMEHGFKRGDKWDQWGGPTDAMKRVHRQLAELFLELRKQEFPKIGALGFVAGGPSEGNPAGVHVCHRPLSIEIAMQECEGQSPGDRFPVNKTFSTASEYIQSLIWLLENELDRSTNPDIDVDAGRSGGMLLYAARDFQRFVTEKWLDRSQEQGPFVLMHGDLHNHYSNMLWDEDLNLVGVIDWEWSQVVPLQLFTPPVWLENTTVDSLAIHQWLFQREVGYLLEEMRLVEDARGGAHTLSREWAKMETWCHPLIVSALFRPKDVYEVYWAFLCKERFEVDDPEARPEMMVKTVLEWEKSEDIQKWLREKQVIQDKYNEEEDSYVFIDEEKDKQDEETGARGESRTKTPTNEGQDRPSHRHEDIDWVVVNAGTDCAKHGFEMIDSDEARCWCGGPNPDVCRQKGHRWPLCKVDRGDLELLPKQPDESSHQSHDKEDNDNEKGNAVSDGEHQPSGEIPTADPLKEAKERRRMAIPPAPHNSSGPFSKLTVLTELLDPTRNDEKDLCAANEKRHRGKGNDKGRDEGEGNFTRTC